MSSKSQLKLTVTAEERAYLEAEASKRNISVSALLHEKVFENGVKKPAHNNPRDTTRMKDVWINMPEQLAIDLKEMADAYGYSMSKYVTLLLSQPERPIILKYDHLTNSKELAALHKLEKDFTMLANMARQNGDLNSAELDSITREASVLTEQLKTCIRGLNKKTITLVNEMRRELVHEIKEVRKNGSSRDNTDS